jgi:hypothetical protein
MTLIPTCHQKLYPSGDPVPLLVNRKVVTLTGPGLAAVRLLVVDNLSSPLMPFVGTDDIQEAFILSLQVNRCSGSMNFLCGSRSADPCLLLMIQIRISDPDHAIFVIDLQDANKKLIKKERFPPFYFLKVHLLFRMCAH